MTAVFTTNGTTTETCPCGPCKAANDSVAQRVAAMLRVDKLRENGWKVELPGDQWAIMRDPETVTNGQRKTFKEAAFAISLMGEQIEQAAKVGNTPVVETLVLRQAALGSGIEAHQIAIFVTSWSYEHPVPNPHDNSPLLLIPSRAFDKLQKVAKDLWQASGFDDEVSSDTSSPFGSSES